MEPMLTKSLALSNPDRMGLGVCERRIPKYWFARKNSKQPNGRGRV